MQVKCPSCNEITEHSKIREEAKTIINGINITVQHEVLRCQKCLNSHPMDGSPDILKLVAAEYKRRTGHDLVNYGPVK